MDSIIAEGEELASNIENEIVAVVSGSGDVATEADQDMDDTSSNSDSTYIPYAIGDAEESEESEEDDASS